MDALSSPLAAAGPWLYVAYFLVAFLESFVLTTFFLSGTLAFVATGTIIVLGNIDGAVVFFIYTGTLVGDTLSFALSGRLQRVDWISSKLVKVERFRMPLALKPVSFMSAAQLVPYLRGVTAFLAGGVLPWTTFIRAEILGALAGTAFFVGLGAAGGLLMFVADDMNTVGSLAGIVALLVVIVGWIRLLRPCRIEQMGTSAPSASARSRIFKWTVGLLYYALLWHPIRWLEGLLRKLPARAARRNLRRAFPDARPGDIFLIRLHTRAPWGTWAHTAIAIGDGKFAHGFAERFSAHRLDALPVRYAIAHLRVKCKDEIAAAAAAAAVALIGTRVSVWAHPRSLKAVSCTSAVAHAYDTVGITFWPADGSRIVPDNLMRSEMVEHIRTVYTERRRHQSADGAAGVDQPA